MKIKQKIKGGLEKGKSFLQNLRDKGNNLVLKQRVELADDIGYEKKWLSDTEKVLEEIDKSKINNDKMVLQYSALSVLSRINDKNKLDDLENFVLQLRGNKQEMVDEVDKSKLTSKMFLEYSDDQDMLKIIKYLSKLNDDSLLGDTQSFFGTETRNEVKVGGEKVSVMHNSPGKLRFLKSPIDLDGKPILRISGVGTISNESMEIDVNFKEDGTVQLYGDNELFSDGKKVVLNYNGITHIIDKNSEFMDDGNLL